MFMPSRLPQRGRSSPELEVRCKGRQERGKRKSHAIRSERKVVAV